MDNLTMDMRACEKAGFGVSYGKWKATQPVKVPDVKQEESGGVCVVCGKHFFGKFTKKRKYCDDVCAGIASRMRKREKNG